MPTPSGRFKNWTGVIFTPETGSPVTLFGVTDVQIDPRAQLISGAGDADIGPSSKSLAQSDPQITIEFEHLASLISLTPGMRGAFAAIHNDADNEEGTGAMKYTAAYAMIGNTPRGGRFRQYGTSRLTIETWMPDGRTYPISVSVQV
jgi:hypothetical protein